LKIIVQRLEKPELNLSDEAKFEPGEILADLNPKDDN
jgi:hypothetical protein